MKRLLKEPLLHFLLLGVGLFVVYNRMPGSRTATESGKIVITQGQIENLEAGFTRVWQRPPTSEELTGLIQDQVREEVYCREAIALGLDKDDTIIRRRLRQKMEFVSYDIATQTEPTDADLNEYLKAHPDSFHVEQRFTFHQVYLNPQKHGENLERDSLQLLAQLKQSGDRTDVSTLGDELLLDHQFEALPASEIAKQFGEKFTAQLSRLAPRQWVGPIESGYGVHLVFVSERVDGRLPALAEVREAVRREWDNSRRLETNERFYQNVLKQYTVTIKEFEPTMESKKLAANMAK